MGELFYRHESVHAGAERITDAVDVVAGQIHLQDVSILDGARYTTASQHNMLCPVLNGGRELGCQGCIGGGVGASFYCACYWVCDDAGALWS